MNEYSFDFHVSVCPSLRLYGCSRFISFFSLSLSRSLFQHSSWKSTVYTRSNYIDRVPNPALTGARWFGWWRVNWHNIICSTCQPAFRQLFLSTIIRQRVRSVCFLVEDGCWKEEAGAYTYANVASSRLQSLNSCALRSPSPQLGLRFALQHARFYGLLNTIASQLLYPWRRRVVWNIYACKICVPSSTAQVGFGGGWMTSSTFSSTRGDLDVPASWTRTFDKRAFAISGPDSWSDIPVTLRNTSLSPSATHNCHPPRHITFTLRDTSLSPSATHHCHPPWHITVTLRNT